MSILIFALTCAILALSSTALVVESDTRQKVPQEYYDPHQGEP